MSADEMEDELGLEEGRGRGTSAGESDEGDSTSPLAPEFDDETFSDLYTARQGISAPTRCEAIFGCAGTGKSTLLLTRIEEDPSYAVLSSSTGISAVNLGATTINSLLGFFDYDSLRDAYLRKSAQRRLRELVTDGYRNVVLDEISMVSHQTLDTLVNIFDDVNEDLKESQNPIGLIICGDYGQLPPVGDRNPNSRGSRPPTPWSFDAQCFHRFEENTTTLTHVWRQTDERFLRALTHARAGRGTSCVEELAAAGLEFNTFTDMEFEGTTILSENKHVDAFNTEALKRVKGRDMYLPSRRWGKERGEWKNIPVQNKIRENCYVMILANAPGQRRGEFEYVNGEGGHVRGISPKSGSSLPFIEVERVRNGKLVKIPPIVRGVEHREKPDGFSAKDKVDESYYPAPHFSKQKKRYVSGQVQYYPLKLGYGSTVHKSQSLSLNRVQVDVRSWMFSQPAMTYISLSRCRSLEGLRLVGQKEVVAAKCVSDPKVSRWL